MKIVSIYLMGGVRQFTDSKLVRVLPAGNVGFQCLFSSILAVLNVAAAKHWRDSANLTVLDTN